MEYPQVAAEEPADSATVAVGGAVLGVVALFVGGVHLAAHAMGLWLAAKVVQMTGARELPHDE